MQVTVRVELVSVAVAVLLTSLDRLRDVRFEVLYPSLQRTTVLLVLIMTA